MEDVRMDVNLMVTDDLLQRVLEAAARARQQSLAILSLISANHAPTLSLDDQLALSKEQKVLNAHLTSLRALNRKAIFGVRATKQETGEARQEIDSLHLQLQNLYYEQRHLRGEIGGCEGFDHKYMSLPLAPIEDFIAGHPEHKNSSEHDLTIARIEDEHTARLALEVKRQALVKKKDALGKETAAKREELAKVDAEVEKWLQGQDGVRKLFDARVVKTVGTI